MLFGGILLPVFFPCRDPNPAIYHEFSTPHIDISCHNERLYYTFYGNLGCRIILTWQYCIFKMQLFSCRHNPAIDLLHNPTMHQSHIPQCIFFFFYQFLFQNSALWDIVWSIVGFARLVYSHRTWHHLTAYRQECSLCMFNWPKISGSRVIPRLILMSFIVILSLCRSGGEVCIY